MFPRRTCPAGFTLVEVLISMVILGLGLVVILQSYLAAMNAVQSSQDLLTAARFIGGKSTEMEVEAYENDGLAPAVIQGAFPSGGRAFNWTVDIAETRESYRHANDTVSVLVRLDWRERSRKKSASLLSYLPRKKETDRNATAE